MGPREARLANLVLFVAVQYSARDDFRRSEDRTSKSSPVHNTHRSLMHIDELEGYCSGMSPWCLPRDSGPKETIVLS